MGKKSKKSTADIIAKRLAKAQASAFVARPFQGLPGELDIISLRELVPAATATAKLTEEYGGDEVTFASLLPGAWQALHRADGVLLAGLQVPVTSPDPSRDVAAGILAAKDAEPGTFIEADGQPGAGPRLQDILDTSVPFTVSVQSTFDYWLPADESQQDEDVKAALEQANEGIAPTEKLAGASGAYWTEMAGRRYVRWARLEDEDRVMDGLARLHAAGTDTLGGLGKYLGCFRAHGIAIPVWELEGDAQQPDDVDAVLPAFAESLSAAIASDEPLSADERRARAGVVSRQLTIR
ncbi:DUF5926 family protein [Brevibacterium sp. 50QC2O2]|jgi:hypothetical protein|uniref:DUF5926 family protein n=1 Tax=Brevibacterium TaxID=1696 RepID=UPI00211D0792|nr:MULTISPECIES: DUF5926 family protein [unclassified Brevibacterium]MCQ9368037.1 DUF5926 family protein [Brevibacterium sp. 91QC2O2]MCQ9385239.1 DUF5926 family protein [Brevibacterium sp. 68QC2CO]MCQ9388745.1 DUF5926 family protein [Brevibacterium sp. 50QC2O2]